MHKSEEQNETVYALVFLLLISLRLCVCKSKDGNMCQSSYMPQFVNVNDKFIIKGSNINISDTSPMLTRKQLICDYLKVLVEISC